MEGEVYMKIVVVKMPRCLGNIIRKVLRIS
jgi:hypothetical protein